MPSFIRQKAAAALPHREPASTKPSAPPVKKPTAKEASPTKKRTAVDFTSSPSKSATKKTTSSIDLTTSAKGTSKKRSSPGEASPSSSSRTQPAVKKTRVAAPPKDTPPKPAPTTESREASLPSSLPANGQDYIHDPSGLLPQLMESYSVATMQIISSSKMSAKIVRSLDTLVLGKIDMADRNCKPGLVVLYAKAGTASKLVSIAEVVKREVGQKGGKWYQYSALSETMQVIPRKGGKEGKIAESKKAGEDTEMGEAEDEEDESSYFETMKTKQERVLEGTDRKRAVSVLTVYLSRVPIEKLKMKFGEQTNAKK